MSRARLCLHAEDPACVVGVRGWNEVGRRRPGQVGDVTAGDDELMAFRLVLRVPGTPWRDRRGRQWRPVARPGRSRCWGSGRAGRGPAAAAASRPCESRASTASVIRSPSGVERDPVDRDLALQPLGQESRRRRTRGRRPRRPRRTGGRRARRDLADGRAVYGTASKAPGARVPVTDDTVAPSGEHRSSIRERRPPRSAASRGGSRVSSLPVSRSKTLASPPAAGTRTSEPSWSPSTPFVHRRLRRPER